MLMNRSVMIYEQDLAIGKCHNNLIFKLNHIEIRYKYTGVQAEPELRLQISLGNVIKMRLWQECPYVTA